GGGVGRGPLVGVVRCAGSARRAAGDGPLRVATLHTQPVPHRESGDTVRGRTPTIHCDAEDGTCGAWDVDHFETGAYTVNGVPITSTQRAPGWVSTDLDDYCPEHASESQETSAD